MASSLRWFVRPESVRATTLARAHWTELDEYVRKMPSESDFDSVVVEKKPQIFSSDFFLKFLKNVRFSGFGAKSIVFCEQTTPSDQCSAR